MISVSTTISTFTVFNLTKTITCSVRLLVISYHFISASMFRNKYIIMIKGSSVAMTMT